LPLGLLVSGAFTVTVVAAVLVANASEGAAFHARAGAWLGRVLDAEAELGPIDSSAMLFVRVPEVRVLARDRKWEVTLRGVTLELDWRILLRRRWSFRSVQVREAEIHLGWAAPADGSRPSVAEDGTAPTPESAAAPGSADWLAGMLFEGRDEAELRSIRIGTVKVSGPVPLGGVPVFELVSGGEGRYADGRLDWTLQGGSFRGGGETAWAVQRLGGTMGGGNWTVESGDLRSESGASLRLHGVPALRRGELGVGVSLTGWKVDGARPKEEDGSLPFTGMRVALEGLLTAPFPDLAQYRLVGTVRAEGLDLGRARAFELLAGQTGVPELTALKADQAEGKIEWSPGAIRLFDLVYEEPGLTRVEGRLSVVGADVAGVFHVQLPAYMVGRIPGGKPKGFSYPASGWSRALVTVQGPVTAWSEDLTRRLLDQLPEGIGVGPGPEMPVPGWTPEEAKARADRAEALFGELIR
jgi:hypothetical protein